MTFIATFLNVLVFIYFLGENKSQINIFGQTKLYQPTILVTNSHENKLWNNTNWGFKLRGKYVVYKFCCYLQKYF